MIQMIAGTFGLPINDSIKAMTNKSGPFEASAEQEARLVGMGLARYVEQPKNTAAPDPEPEDDVEMDTAPVGFDDTPPEGDELPEDVEMVDLSELTAKELREVGKEYDLTFRANASKADMIRAITEAQAAEATESAEEDESGLDFDPSRAVV